MKKLICLFLMLCLMAGCMRTSRHPQLVAVDSLLVSQPDSALALLRQQLPSFGGTEGGSSSSDRMYYYLLLADACNKCYDTLPSDSIMHEVADFYDAHGTANEQLRAHYLLGCVYRDLGEAPQALDCYHTAIERADTTSKDCNYRLMMSVYGQMADLFHRQNLPQDELQALKLSGNYALLCCDTISYLRSYELIARVYFILGDTIRVIETINKSKKLHLLYGEKRLAYSANGTLAYILLNQGQTDKAGVLLDEFKHHFTQDSCKGAIARGQEMFYAIKSTYYIKVQQLDSAELFARKLIPFNYEVDAYRALLAVFELRKNTDSIIKYARLYEDAVDTLNNHKRTEVVGQMSSMYNYQRYQKIADTEARNAERARYHSIVILLCSLFLIITLSYIYVRLRNKNNQKIIQLSQDYRQSMLDYNKVSAELEKIKLKDTTLQKDKQHEVESLREKVKTFQSRLQAANSSQQLTDFKETNIVTLFKSKSTGSLKVALPTDAEWNRLVKQFSRSVPSVYTALGRDILLSPSELKLCILLLLGFKIADAAILLDTSAQSITNVKAKANKKLFDEPTATTLEKNLTSILSKV